MAADPRRWGFEDEDPRLEYPLLLRSGDQTIILRSDTMAAQARTRKGIPLPSDGLPEEFVQNEILAPAGEPQLFQWDVPGGTAATFAATVEAARAQLTKDYPAWADVFAGEPKAEEAQDEGDEEEGLHQ